MYPVYPKQLIVNFEDDTYPQYVKEQKTAWKQVIANRFC